ncbi:hypothetical protein [Flexivirga caeni]|uniref:Uncharacterized protein n=1 Tax=Flexivirga caeni TaxID=2294115 RepID=A0A3M9M892_9MICO|nr:hypothetical protein [Flexivirga caeni]RNI21093.1 hypothetical protein EFY87_12505 [Flexivirga caeni]
MPGTPNEEWLQHLDYGPLQLSRRQCKDAVKAYRAYFEPREAAQPLVSRTVGDWSWVLRWKQAEFARINNLAYESDPGQRPYADVDLSPNSEFRVHHTLTTADGRITVGSTEEWSAGMTLGSGRFTKFVRVALGHPSPQIKLVPRHHRKRDATNPLDQHFDVTGATVFLPRTVTGGPETFQLDQQLQDSGAGLFHRDKATRQLRKEYAAQMADATHERAAGFFDDNLTALLIEQAHDCKIEFHGSHAFLSHEVSSEDAQIKPDVIGRMFQLAVTLGPALSAATASAPRGQ